MQIQKNIIPWKCHICGKQFATMGGGICKECGKVTCKRCFGFAKLKLLGKMKKPESQLCRICANKRVIASTGSDSQ